MLLRAEGWTPDEERLIFTGGKQRHPILRGEGAERKGKRSVRSDGAEMGVKSGPRVAYRELKTSLFASLCRSCGSRLAVRMRRDPRLDAADALVLGVRDVYGLPPAQPKSGHFTCYLNRTYHVLPTGSRFAVDKSAKVCDSADAFVALVKPLDLLKGLQVHTCSLFFVLEAVGNSNQIA
jgi:hypothetical protein